MAYEGLLANAAITGAAAGGYLYLALELRRRHADSARRTVPAMLLFGIIGVHLSFAAMRQTVAFLSHTDPSLAPIEAPLFYAAAIPAALAIVPLSFMATYALTGKTALARYVMAAFSAIVAVGFFFIAKDGITGPLHSFWGSEFTINSLVAKAMVFLFMTLPAFGAGVVLIHAGRRGSDAASRRARLVGWAMILYYGAFTLDAIGLEGAWLLAERSAMAVAALIGYRAYFAHAPEVSGIPVAQERVG